jgi:hypothetical protein
MHHKKNKKITGTVIEKQQSKLGYATVTFINSKTQKNYCWWNNQSKGYLIST